LAQAGQAKLATKLQTIQAAAILLHLEILRPGEGKEEEMQWGRQVDLVAAVVLGVTVKETEEQELLAKALPVATAPPLVPVAVAAAQGK
jgi:hypothetical protein